MLTKIVALRWVLGIFMSAVFALAVGLSVLVDSRSDSGGGSPAAPAPAMPEDGSAPAERPDSYPDSYEHPEERLPDREESEPSPGLPLLEPAACGPPPAAIRTIRFNLRPGARLANPVSVTVPDADLNVFEFVSGRVNGATATWVVSEAGPITAANAVARSVSRFDRAPEPGGFARAVRASQACL